MRVLIVFMDADSWTPILDDAASILASGLLLSNGIRRDSRVCLVRRWDGYEWLCVEGSRVRNLRPDLESARGLVRAFLGGRGKDAARVGRGLPPLPGRAFEAKTGPGSLPPPCSDPLSIVFNHRGEYGELEPLYVAPPPRLTASLIAAVNILLDRVCHDGLGHAGGGPARQGG